MVKLHRLLFAVFVALIVVRLGNVHVKSNAGFSLRKVTSHLAYCSKWDVGVLDVIERARLDRILDQKFSYLGKGAQCYVFSSEDGAYVLKLLKLQHLSMPLWVKNMFMPSFFDRLRSASLRRKSEKLEAHFGSYMLAYEALREETGFIYLHLNRGGDLGKVVTIVDKRGTEHRLDLEEMAFLVQERVVLFADRLSELMEAGEEEGAVALIDQAVDLVARRYQKGIVDTDPAFLQNYGVVAEEDRVIQVDVGRFCCDDDVVARGEAEMNRELEQLRCWCVERWPVLAERLEERIELFVLEAAR